MYVLALSLINSLDNLTEQSIALQLHWAKIEAYFVRDTETSEQLFDGIIKYTRFFISLIYPIRVQSKSLEVWKEAVDAQVTDEG